MTEAGTLLAALQFGDGQFPGGAFAFSWGLESLAADGLVRRGELAAFLAGQLRQRWATLDAVLTARAHAAAVDSLPALDDLAEALLLPEAARLGSRRAGAALLGSHARLHTPGAAAYRALIDRGEARGHLPVVQGFVLAGAGLDRESALAVAAYGLVTSLGTAAVRLGLVGHLEVQRALLALRPGIAALVAGVSDDLDSLRSFTPLADIALQRHAVQAQRLFSN